ncbi:MAG: DUF4157 domain-containing protein [Myxococcaceae bacterium]|nr:DUF4157 domain-containing protein [Myxococcaceae bacterium]
MRIPDKKTQGRPSAPSRAQASAGSRPVAAARSTSVSAARADGFGARATSFPQKFAGPTGTPPDPKLLKKLIDPFINALLAGTLKTKVSQLTPAQQQLLQGVFGKDVDFSNVRLVKMPPDLEKALMVLTGGPARAFTVGEMIILPAAEYAKVTSGQNNALLVHEAAHVLQYRQTGVNVAIESLTGQGEHGAGFYDWGPTLANGGRWSDLNVESRAHLIDEAYSGGFFDDPKNRFYVSADGKSHVVVGPGESPPDGYVDVTREVRNGVRDLRGEPPLPEPRDLPPAVV